MHEIVWKGPWELHRSDETKDGYPLYTILLGKSFGLCIGQCLLYLSSHVKNFVVMTKRQVCWIILCDCSLRRGVDDIRMSLSVKGDIVSSGA